MVVADRAAWRRRWCAREAEALLLENNLIKTLAPRFNILFRRRQELPVPEDRVAPLPARRLLPRRGRQEAPLLRPVPERLGGQGIDPAAAEGVPPAHLRGHGVRQPHPAVPALPDQALLGAVRRLHRPEDYARDVANAERFLEGEQQELMDSLQAQMMAHAEALQFEQAAEMRNQIGSLARVLHQQSVEDNTGARTTRRRHPRGQGRGRPGLRQPGDGARRPAPRRPAVLPEAGRGRDRGGARGGGGRRGRDAAGRPPRPRCGCSRPSSPSTTSKAAVPPLLVVSHAGRQGADRGAGGAERACKVTVPAPAARAAPGLARHVHQRRRDRAGAAAGRGRLAAGAHPRAGRCARPAGRGPGRLPRRVLRHQPHRRRVDPGVVRRLRGPQDAERAVPPLQHRRHHPRRRLRGDAPGADAPLRQAGRGGRARALARLPDLVLVDGGQGPGLVAREVFEELGIELAPHRRRGEGRGPQGRPRGAGVRRRPAEGRRSAASRRR